MNVGPHSQNITLVLTWKMVWDLSVNFNFDTNRSHSAINSKIYGCRGDTNEFHFSGVCTEYYLIRQRSREINILYKDKHFLLLIYGLFQTKL